MTSSQKPDNVASVMKVFSILEGLAEDGGLGLTELAQRTLMSKSTAYRFLQTMKQLGYVSQDQDSERYALTLKTFEVGAAALSDVDLPRLADAQMRKLSEQTHEAIHLGVLDEDHRHVLYVHKYDSQFNLCMQTRVGRRNPIYSTAMGKAMMAWMDPERAEELARSFDYVARTPHTLVSAEALLAELPVIRREGIAEDREEAELGVRCVAVPVFDRFGVAVAAISLSFPVVRFDQSNRERYIALLHEAGRRISRGLGHHDYDVGATP